LATLASMVALHLQEKVGIPEHMLTAGAYVATGGLSTAGGLAAVAGFTTLRVLLEARHNIHLGVKANKRFADQLSHEADEDRRHNCHIVAAVAKTLGDILIEDLPMDVILEIDRENVGHFITGIPQSFEAAMGSELAPEELSDEKLPALIEAAAKEETKNQPWGETGLWLAVLELMVENSPAGAGSQTGISLMGHTRTKIAEAWQANFVHRFFLTIKTDLELKGAAFASIHLRMMTELLVLARQQAESTKRLESGLGALMTLVSSVAGQIADANHELQPYCMRIEGLITQFREDFLAAQRDVAGRLEDLNTVVHKEGQLTRDALVPTLDQIKALLGGNCPYILSAPAQPLVDVAKIPASLTPVFLGRDKELPQLDQAWETPEGGPEAAKIAVVVVVAPPGVGKTTLVKEWIARFRNDRWRGAHRVYAWSFFSQGMSEDRAFSASEDRFLADALQWFGVPCEPMVHASEKGRLLAGALSKERTLLILDGLEPLQHPPGVLQGTLKADGLHTLLRQLALGEYPGLCVITTREPIADLVDALRNEDRPDGPVVQIDLRNLEPEDGAKLLHRLGVTKAGPVDIQPGDSELINAAREFGGHALALTLLGTYLRDAKAGDVLRRDAIPSVADMKTRPAEHARRVMKAYEVWLRDTLEIEILRVMGLFDRPSATSALQAVRAAPAIPSLTERFAAASDDDWRLAVSRLKELRVVEEVDEDGTLDCHPLFREYFGEELRTKSKAAWQEAHRRLYEYYRAIPQKHLPATAAELEPLFAAIPHGCCAGLHLDAFWHVYFMRIQQGPRQFASTYIGARGALIGSLSSFFAHCWSTPHQNLGPIEQRFVLGQAAGILRAAGRMQNALEAVLAAVHHFPQELAPDDLADALGMMSDMNLTLGKVTAALCHAREAAGVTVSSLNIECGIASYLINALHHAGELSEALAINEDLNRRRCQSLRCSQARLPLGSTQCAALLSSGRAEEARRGALLNVQLPSGEWEQSRETVFGLQNMQLAEIAIAAVQGGTSEASDATRRFSRLAVTQLRRVGCLDSLAAALIVRAKASWVCRDFSDAWSDLSEARDIAGRYEMRLYVAECELESARIWMAEHAARQDATVLPKAREALARAKIMLDDMGYGRRQPEYELAAARLALAEGDMNAARQHLDAARPWILPIGKGGKGFLCHKLGLAELDKRIALNS